MNRPSNLNVIGCKWTFQRKIDENDNVRHKVRLVDVKTAFFHSELQENILMEPPKGLKLGRDKVCKLQKSIFGLKQSAKC